MSDETNFNKEQISLFHSNHLTFDIYKYFNLRENN